VSYQVQGFEGKNVIFIGQGREWESFQSFITKHAHLKSIQSIFITDENRAQYDQKLRSLDFTDTIIVKTAGYPGRLVPAPYTTPTKVFFECVKQIGAKTIGITGTKGKTTSASLLAHILKRSGKPVVLAGNMGLPMLDTLETITPETLVVLELSSYQLNELEVSPDVAIITNLYRDHVDYHGTLENYWEAKHNIIRYMDSASTVVFNPETEVVLHWLAESDAKQVAIDTTEQVDMSQTELIGDHNRINYLLVRAAAEALGVEKLTSIAGLKTFKPIKHRLEKVRVVKGITFIDDAIASNPDAAIAGITACVREVGPVGCVFLGGQDRDYDFSALAKLLHTLLVPKLVLFPDTGAKIKALLPETYQPECFETTDMMAAVKWAGENCPSGSVCLLSSGSPSYSLWKDFEEKGDQFQNAIMLLSN
jgi:UDP-N-acetylmuramoylalanine--D-glutamate ligase